MPYEVETNSKEFEGRPIIMLSSKEKINELRSIISEQENKIHFLDLVSQKFINLINKDGNVDINQLMNQIENNKELYQKINLLEKENQKLLNELNEQKNNKEKLNLNMNKINNDNNNSNSNKIEENKNNINNNVINNNYNNIKENNNLYKHNSIKGISFTPYVSKNNLNFDYNDNYNENYNYNFNNNINRVPTPQQNYNYNNQNRISSPQFQTQQKNYFNQNLKSSPIYQTNYQKQIEPPSNNNRYNINNQNYSQRQIQNAEPIY